MQSNATFTCVFIGFQNKNKTSNNTVANEYDIKTPRESVKLEQRQRNGGSSTRIYPEGFFFFFFMLINNFYL